MIFLYYFLLLDWKYCVPKVKDNSYPVCSGSKINFFWQAPTGDQNFFCSRQMEKCGCQKVLVKLFLCSETQAKIIGRHGLAGKRFAIDVIRYQTSAEIIF